MSAEGDHFFAAMPSFASFADFSRAEHYLPLPPDWLVVISDIRGSTTAIERGAYREVNAVSAASIVAVLNAVSGLQVPYVFGGDGAKLCIPPSREQAVRGALAASRQLADRSFALELRVGIVPMAVIAAAGYSKAVAKYQPAASFQQARFRGDGLRWAEALVKAAGATNPYLLGEAVVAAGSFEGFECRWRELPSPQEETVALMVQALGRQAAEDATYRQVFAAIDAAYGDEAAHHPVRVENLAMTFSPKKLGIEAPIRNALSGTVGRFAYLLKLVLFALLGRILMGWGVRTETVNWGDYKRDFVTNTDYRKFDETLRMVLSSSVAQRESLVSFLDELVVRGQIVYRAHPAPAAIATCLITSYQQQHVHFVDGAAAGYAMAASAMKRQLRQRISAG